MDNVNQEVNSVAFSMLVLSLIASAFSAILGLVIYSHTPFRGVLTTLFVIFLLVGITMSFIKS